MEPRQHISHRRRRLHRQPHGAAAARARRARGGARRPIRRLSPGGARRAAGGRQRRRPRHWSTRLLAEHRVDTIMHFAAHTIVPESVREPAQVLRQQHLLDALAARGCLAGRRAALRVLLDRRRLRHPGRAALAAEDTADRADQSLRHLQAHVRMDAARPVARPPPLRYVALRYFNVAGSDTAGPHRPVDAATPRCSSRWPARWRSASVRTCRSSAPTTRPPTAPACATTSTSRTWPRAHLDALDYLRGGGDSHDRQLSAMATATACARCSRAWSASPGGALAVREEPRRAGRPAGAGGPRRAHPQRARLAPAAGRHRHHRAHLARLGAAAAARALVVAEAPIRDACGHAR